VAVAVVVRQLQCQTTSCAQLQIQPDAQEQQAVLVVEQHHRGMHLTGAQQVVEVQSQSVEQLSQHKLVTSVQFITEALVLAAVRDQLQQLQQLVQD
jgi:hypothetical protein